MPRAVIIVDHGSRNAESNELLIRAAAAFARRYAHKYPIVEPAHMDLAEPSIDAAFARCVDRGADEIVLVPYLLGAGRHATRDIPLLAARAAERFPGVRWRVAGPLGLDDALLDLLDRRIDELPAT